MNQENKICQNCKNQFTIEPDDFAFYQKIDVPPPKWCSECRYIRRLLDRNEYNMYRRKCDATGESIISIYRQEQPFPVYKQDYWKSDAWDAITYGRDFDFSRPFFEQYEELRKVVPHLSLVNSNSVNSEYTNQAQDNKDCYMLVTSNTSEKCMYGSWCQNDCYFLSDCYMVEGSELCYEAINLTKCSRCAWVYDCSDCVNVYFSSDCRGCNNCFGCVGLRNKQYYWQNKPLTKADWEKKFKEFAWTHKEIKKAQNNLAELKRKFPTKYYHGSKMQNSTGDYLENVKGVHTSFNCRDNKDTAYMQDAWNKTEDCLDCTEIIKGELSYQIQGVETPHRTIVARSCFNTIVDSCYCDMCFGVRNCFGCFGLKSKEYCILNKQYTKEEYLALRPKIIDHMRRTGEWGEYFPPNVSPFSYNESMAQDYFPLTREQALAKGYSWYDRQDRDYKITMPWDKLPLTINEVDDTMLDQVISCRTQDNPEEKITHPLCTGAFKIVPIELTLYRKMGLPIPEKCFPCRRTDRFKIRNPRRLWYRSCQCNGRTNENKNYTNTAPHFHGDDQCPNEFETSYAPDRPEIVYCESCYNSEVV